jgi:hypothetical protein
VPLAQLIFSSATLLQSPSSAGTEREAPLRMREAPLRMREALLRMREAPLRMRIPSNFN